MKSMPCILVVLTLFSVCPALAQKERPLSANGQPLTFQIIGASVTRKPQTTERLAGIAMTGLTAERAVRGGTYSGPMQDIYAYDPMELGPSESFLILRFNVSNVKRKVWLWQKDLQLTDGAGAVHQGLGRPGQKEASWHHLADRGLEPKKNNIDTWLFTVATDKVAGAVIHFQNSAYPLSIGNKPIE